MRRRTGDARRLTFVADAVERRNGRERDERIAAPMVGAMITSTILTLVVIPAIYYLWRKPEARRVAR